MIARAGASRVVGIDLAPEAIATASERVGAAAEFQVGDVRDPALRGGSVRPRGLLRGARASGGSGARDHRAEGRLARGRPAGCLLAQPRGVPAREPAPPSRVHARGVSGRAHRKVRQRRLDAPASLARLADRQRRPRLPGEESLRAWLRGRTSPWTRGPTWSRSRATAPSTSRRRSACSRRPPSSPPSRRRSARLRRGSRSSVPRCRPSTRGSSEMRSSGGAGGAQPPRTKTGPGCGALSGGERDEGQGPAGASGDRAGAAKPRALAELADHAPPSRCRRGVPEAVAVAKAVRGSSPESSMSGRAQAAAEVVRGFSRSGCRCRRRRRPDGQRASCPGSPRGRRTSSLWRSAGSASAARPPSRGRRARRTAARRRARRSAARSRRRPRPPRPPSATPTSRRRRPRCPSAGRGRSGGGRCRVPAPDRHSARATSHTFSARTSPRNAPSWCQRL